MPVRPILLLTLLVAASLYSVSAQTPPASAPLKATSQLVILDVVVTDSKQNPVHNLTASDFTVLENLSPVAVPPAAEPLARRQ
jgi:hypothetical protein